MLSIHAAGFTQSKSPARRFTWSSQIWASIRARLAAVGATMVLRSFNDRMLRDVGLDRGEVEDGFRLATSRHELSAQRRRSQLVTSALASGGERR